MLLSGTEALQQLLSNKKATGPEHLVQAALIALIDIAKNVEMAALMIRHGLEDIINLTVCKVSQLSYCKNYIVSQDNYRN